MRNNTEITNLSIIDHKIKIYTEAYYMHRLLEERSRAERSNAPLSQIVIEIKPSLGNGNGNGKLVSKVGTVLHHSTRKTDIKGWYQQDKIAILMPETPKEGALKLAEKISMELKKNLNGKPHDTVNHKLVICTYGANIADTQVTLLQSDMSEATAQPPSCARLTQHKCIDDPELALAAILCNPPHSFSIHLKKCLKRAIDIMGSLAGMIMLLPFFIIISAVIKLTSPGPVLFKQERNGYRGKKFLFLKFRSMRHNADDDIHRTYVNGLLKDCNGEKPWAKLTHDPRITPFGSFLRKTSLDELPQLWNVLKGDMSLVGPRPPIPYEVEQYQLWHWKRTLDVKPGITGLWQVEGRSCSTFTTMVRMDLKYINNWSLWLDMKILCKTVYVVFSTRGAS